VNTRLTEIAADPERVEKLSKDEVCSLIGELATLGARLQFRLAELGNGFQSCSDSDGDRLLTVNEAAQMLSCSKDRLYRHPAEFRSFEVRTGGRLRYSRRALERFIRSRLGR
jgi:excisionase family DNA binding protein